MPSIEEAWRLRLAHTDLVGGEFEVCEPGAMITRGPIRSIVVEAGTLVIAVNRAAYIDCNRDCLVTGQYWRELRGVEPFIYDLTKPPFSASAPKETAGGCITFTAAFMRCMIHPRGGSTLNWRQVRR